MAKPLVITLIVVAMLAIVLVAGGMLLPQSEWARGQLETRLSERLDGRAVSVGGLRVDWGFPLGIELEDVHVANADWAEEPTFFAAERVGLSLGVGALLRGKMDVSRLELEQPVVRLERRADGTNNWAVLKSDDPDDDESPFEPDVFQLSGGRLRYHDDQLEAYVDIELATTGEDERQRPRELRVVGAGEVKGRPLQFGVVGGPPSEALDARVPYALNAEGSLGQVRFGFDGTADDLMGLDGLHGHLAIEAPESAELTPAQLDVPAFTLQAQIAHTDARWAVTDIDLTSGDTRLGGSVVYQGGEPSHVDVELFANQLDLNRWGVLEAVQARREAGQAEESADSGPDWQEGLAGLLEPLRRHRGVANINIGRLEYGQTQLRELIVRGRLDDGALQLQHLHAVQGEGRIEAEGALQFGDQPLSGKFDARIEQLDLGQALAPFGLDDWGRLDGRVHLVLEQDDLAIADTQLSYVAPKQQLEIELAVRTHGKAGMHVEGSGARHGVPFRFDLTLGAPLQLLSGEQPYTVQGSLDAGETRLEVDGAVTRPLQPSAAGGTLSIKGPNPEQLEPLLGVDLPNLPPYQASAELSWEPPLLKLQGLNARFGESDVRGDLRLRLQEQPMLWATLRSKQLRLRDARPLQEATTEPEPEDTRVFADEPWNLDSLHALDARIDYQADNLVVGDIPLQALALELSLENGLLRVDPFKLGVSGGEANARMKLDARQAPLDAELQLSLRQARLEAMLQTADVPAIAEESQAILGGEVDLRGSGGSMDQLMANLDGDVQLALSRGLLDRLLVALLGLDLGEALAAYMAGDDDVALHCAFTHLVARRGQVEVENFFISTADANFTGGGNVDLDRETLELVIEAHPKNPSVLIANTPIRVEGGLGDPSVSIVSRQLLGRGVATVIGAAIAPPLAILPWVNLGRGEDKGMGCEAALRDFHPAEEPEAPE